MEDLTYITESLRPLAVPIEEVHEDPANANMHDERNLRAIMGSLARYGQRKPVVVNRNGGVCEAGNGTLEAARRLGWSHIAAVFVEDDAATHAGYSIADNRTGELSYFDTEALAVLLQSVAEDEEDLFASTGFADADLQLMIEGVMALPEDVEFPEYDESVADDVDMLECPECGHRFPA
jgi:ParB-like chromosome segregation protein Spo0J